MQHKTLTFGAFTLDAVRGALMKGDAEIRLRPKSLEVLRFLARNANRLVTKDEIFAAVWGETVVTDDSLTQCLIDVRRAIGDESHEIVRTVPRRGYILDIPVSERDSPGADGASAAGRSGAAAGRRAWLVGAFLLACASAAFWWAMRDRAADATDPGPRAPSIAVLPFVDLSDAQDQQFFAEGMSEEILNALAQSLDLRVIARTSSFSFRDRQNLDIAAIAGRLGVTHVLEGSVRKSGDRVRITAQLVGAADSSHLWSQTYDREVGDMLAVQADIAEHIAATLKVRLSREALAAAGRRIDPGAQEHFLHGRFLHNRRLPGDLAAAEEHFLAAIAIDGRYAPAWAALAGTLLVRLSEEEGDPDVALERTREAVTRALELDPLLPEAQVRAAGYYFQSGDFAQVQRHRQRAHELAPDNPLVLGSEVGTAILRGDYQRAVDLQRRAVALDPLNATGRQNLALELARIGAHPEAAEQLARAKELSPGQERLKQVEMELLVMSGRYDEALSMARQLAAGPAREQILAIAYHGLGRDADADTAIGRLRLYDDPELPRRLAEVHAQRGEIEKAFELLPAARDADIAQARTPGERSRPFRVATSVLLQPLHADSRWGEMIPRGGESF